MFLDKGRALDQLAQLLVPLSILFHPPLGLQRVTLTGRNLDFDHIIIIFLLYRPINLSLLHLLW